MARPRLVAVAVIAGSLACVSPATAATITVTTTQDEMHSGDGKCSLREAIADVNNPPGNGDCSTPSGGGNTIRLGAHTYALGPSSADSNDYGHLQLTAPAPVMISGAGPSKTRVDASGLGNRTQTLCAGCDRVLDVAVTVTATLNGLTITGGHAPDGASGLDGDDSSNPSAPNGGTGGDGQDGGGIFNAGSLTLMRVTVAYNQAGRGGNGGNGSVEGGNGGTGGRGGEGGGIYNAGKLKVLESTISHNFAGREGNGGRAGTPGAGGDAGNYGGDGGGIRSTGSLTLSASTVSGNFGGDGGDGGNGGASGCSPGGTGGMATGGGWGGAISIVDGTFLATNDTLVDNFAGSGGTGGTGGSSNCGGLPADGGNGGGGGGAGNGGAMRMSGSGTATLINVTVADNSIGAAGSGGQPGTGTSGGSSGQKGADGGQGTGGGVWSDAGANINLRNSIDSSNTGGNCGEAPNGSTTDLGHNLEFGDSTCFFTGPSGNPELRPLAAYGGPTQTMAIGLGSAARNRVPASGAGCPKTDQRGVARPQGAACDIGAYEYAPLTCANLNLKTTVNTSLVLSLSCRDPAGLPVVYAIRSKPSHGRLGTLNKTSGRVTYKPAAGYSGGDRFTYRASDRNGIASDATVTISVTKR